MCRILGCVAPDPVSLRYELVEAPNPFIRQSEDHDSGWGIAAYERAFGQPPRLVRFPEAAYLDEEFGEATALTARIFNAHVRRATLGGLTLVNTHPFVLGNYSFAHNGTIINFPALDEPRDPPLAGETDSEHFFNFVMRRFDPGDVVGSLRRAVTGVIDRSSFSGLNFLFSDGERLYAYRLGIFELHWSARNDRLLVASERSDRGVWHTVQQDVLLVLDPARPAAPHAERLVGDAVAGRAGIEKYEEGEDLRGEERGAFAAERAARLAAGSRA